MRAQALAIGAGDILAGAGLVERQAGLGGELLADGLQFPAAQRLDEVAGEDDAPSLPLGQSLADEMLGASVKCLAHLGAKAAV